MGLQIITKIEALRIAAVATWQATALKCSVTVRTGRSWTDIPFTAGTATMSDSTTDTDSGQLHTSKVECSVPGDDSTLLNMYDILSGGDCLVKYTYNDGTARIVGQPNFPARLTCQQETGNSSQTRLTFQSKSPFPPLLAV